MKTPFVKDSAARFAGAGGDTPMPAGQRNAVQRPGPRRWSRTSLTVALGVAVACVLAGCSGKPSPAGTSTAARDVSLSATQKKSIHVVTVAPTTYRAAVAATGVIDFDHNRATPVLAPFSGAVTKVLVTLGETVHKGQPLARINSAGFASAVGAYRKAVLAAKAADSVAASDRDLFAHGAISARENAGAQAAAVGADTTRTAALQQLQTLHMSDAAIAAIRAGKTTSGSEGVLRAPISGTVVVKSIAPGRQLTAGSTPCFTIANTGTMWALADVFGADIGKVHTGDPATVDPGDGGAALTGKVTRVGTVVDPATRSVAVRIAIANPHGRLRKGMYISASIRSRIASQGMLLPVSAVLRDAENLPFVYVVTKAGSYARQPIRLGARIGNRFVISSGLHAGDKVVVDGSIFLRFIQTQ